MDREQAIAEGYQLGDIETVGHLRGRAYGIGHEQLHDALCFALPGNADRPLEQVRALIELSERRPVRNIELTAADVVMIRDALAILDPDEDGDRARDRCDTLSAIFDELVNSGAQDFTLSVESGT